MRGLKIIGYGTDCGCEKYFFGKDVRHRMGAGQDHYSMSKTAVDRAMERAGLCMEDMDLVVFAGAIGYQPIPCSAALIKSLYPTRRPVPCMDINTTCTSFITAVDTISYMLDAGRYKRVLILSADTASLGLNPNQKESFELFSDGSAAFILERDETGGAGVICGLQMTWSEGAHDTEIRGGLSSLPPNRYEEGNHEEYLFDMKGFLILNRVTVAVPRFIEELEAVMGTPVRDLDMIIPHQASRALPLIMRKLGIPKSKYVNRVSEYGNMIASSVPYMLSLALEEALIKPGDRILLFGTAAGLTINGVVLKY